MELVFEGKFRQFDYSDRQITSYVAHMKCFLRGENQEKRRRTSTKVTKSLNRLQYSHTALFPLALFRRI
jgi:hypothetical protein